MERDDRDRLDRVLEELRAYLERRSRHPVYDRRVERWLGALDALIASERQAVATAERLWDADGFCHWCGVKRGHAHAADEAGAPCVFAERDLVATAAGGGEESKP